MLPRTMKTRLLLWSLGMFLAAMGAVFFIATEAVNADLEHEARERARRELDTVAWLLARHAPFADQRAFDAWIDEVGGRLGTRLTFIAGGKVLADSMVGFDELRTMDDHSTRPEVAAAREQGSGSSLRFSATLGRSMLYAAKPVPAVADLPAGILRAAVPLSDITDRVGELQRNLLLLLVAVLALGGLLLFGVSRSVSRSVNALSTLARDIGRGDFGRRIREVPGAEFQPLAESVNLMARRIEEHVATIEDQGGRLQAMFDGLSEGVLVLDTFGRIESFNRAMAGIYPQVATYTGRTPLEATMNLAVQDVVEQLLGADEPGSREISMATKDGRHLDVSAVSFMVGADERKLVLVFRDVTEARRGERMLRDFVANASHQLRTPLTSIKGYAETLLASPPGDPEKARSFLTTIEKNATHMSEVVSSLLALAKSEQLKRTEPGAVDSCAVIRQAAADLAPRAEEKHMPIEMRLAEDRLMVQADGEGLLHVFHNLLENAVKYGPEHSTITVIAAREGGEVVFDVSDQGGGIAEEHRERIFERFYRVDDNAVGDGSAGLGLAICRKIVENYGGSISCLSPGEAPDATCFRFTLKPAEPGGHNETRAETAK